MTYLTRRALIELALLTGGATMFYDLCAVSQEDYMNKAEMSDKPILKETPLNDAKLVLEHNGIGSQRFERGWAKLKEIDGEAGE